MSKGVGPLRVLQIALQNGFQLISYGFLRGVAVCVGLLLTSAISADSNFVNILLRKLRYGLKSNKNLRIYSIKW